MRKLTLLAAASLAALATPAAATVTFGNQTQGQGQEVLLGSGTTGNPVTGQTNQTHTSITFTSGSTTTCSGCPTQILFEPSSGQARIEATSALTGGSQVPLQDITISLTPPLSNPLEGIGYIEFNLSMSGQVGNAISVVINAVDQNGNPFTTSGTLGNGSTFFSALASGGEVIRSISFDANADAGITDIRQIRLSPAIGGQVTTFLPEPGTWAMMLLGFGAVGFGMRRSRKALLTQIA
jgi:hypothetical protein